MTVTADSFYYDPLTYATGSTASILADKANNIIRLYTGATGTFNEFKMYGGYSTHSKDLIVGGTAFREPHGRTGLSVYSASGGLIELNSGGKDYAINYIDSSNHSCFYDARSKGTNLYLSTASGTGCIALNTNTYRRLGIASNGTVTINTNCIIDSTGKITTKPVWGKIFIPGSSMIPQPSASPTIATPSSGNLNGLYMYSFGLNDTTKYLHFTVDMPSDWQEGTDIYVSCSYAGSTSGLNNNIGFTFTYSWINAGAQFPVQNWLNLTGVMDPDRPEGNFTTNLSKLSISGSTGTKINSKMICSLTRKNPSVGRDASTEYLIGVNIYYLRNKLGSTNNTSN